MLIKSRKFGRATGLAALVGIAFAIQPSMAADSKAVGDVAERLARVEQQVQRIESQVAGARRSGNHRNVGYVSARTSGTSYPWRQRMLEGN